MILLERFKRVKVFVFDMDGVLTDGSLLVFESGEQVRQMNIKDGFALALAIKKGYKIIVISGSHSQGAVLRLNKLGISDVYMRVTDKKGKLEELLQQYNFTWNDVLFMGDDIPDYTVMKHVGLACAPADAAADIKQIAHYISPLPGGRGCVREMIEKVLKIHDKWELDTDVPSK